MQRTPVFACTVMLTLVFIGSTLRFADDAGIQSPNASRASRASETLSIQAVRQAESATPRVVASAPPQPAILQPTRVRLGESDAHCGPSLLSAFGVQLSVEVASEFVIVRVVSGNTSDLWVTGRAVGPALVGLNVSRRGAEFRISTQPTGWPRGQYEADILVSWVGRRYLGQKWSLPNRNDNPPFEEMKRKCLALSLDGRGCDRYGVGVWKGDITSTGADAATRPRECEWNANGFWVPSASPSKLLDDPVGLNRFRGEVWEWTVPGCPPIERTAQEIAKALLDAGIRRIGLFGDSMLVEQFHMLHNLLGRDAKIVSGRLRRLRSLEFTTSEGITVKFHRSYTTGGGHSLIAQPSTIVEQLAGFGPDAVLGNLAVLHWQQNSRSVSDWTSNLRSFAGAFRKRFPQLNSSRAFYLGPTLIQMGRTQGLEPARTQQFFKAAREILSPTFDTVRPMHLSVSRRESAFDGQHWACYHQYGGVSHTISQLFLRHLVP